MKRSATSDEAAASEEAAADGRARASGRKRPKQEPTVAVDVQVGSPSPSLNDVQNLLLRVFTSEFGENPKWVCVRGMNLVKTAVVVLLPCLDAGTLRDNSCAAPLMSRLLKGPGGLHARSAGEVEHFPGSDVGLAGDRMLRTLLSARGKPSVTGKKKASAAAPADAAGPKLPIRAYLASASERERSEYPAVGPSGKLPAGWVSTRGHGGGLEAMEDREDSELLVGLDCEMVMTASGPALARVSLVGAEGNVLYDTLVRPSEEVTDYLTQYSGITADALSGVEVTLADVQARLLGGLVSEQSILVGHSLESDLRALRLVHERVVDTVLLYPHSRGWPHRHGLASLVSSHLKRKLDRQAGHDSVADARAALELALLKFEKGPAYGSSASARESVPLGRLLVAAGSRLVLSDTGAGAESPKMADWFLEGCSQGAEGGATGACGAAGAGGARCVRLLLWREFEALCAARAAAEAAEATAAAGRGGAAATGGAASATAPERAAVEECLRQLDGQLASLAGATQPGSLLLVASGCGDWHRMRRLRKEHDGAEAEGEDLRCARQAFKDSFLLLAAAGPALLAAVSSAGYVIGSGQVAESGRPAAPPLRREAVSYDL